MKFEEYVGDPLTVFVLLLFPDLSLHCVTVELDSVNVVASDASNHNAQPGIFMGDKVLPGKLFSSPHLAAR